MTFLRSLFRSVKAILFFAWFGVKLLIKRPQTPQARAEWLHNFCAAMMRAFKVKLTLEGSFPERGVLISNHTGYLDILAYAAMGPVVYCAKAEMEGWPVLGWMATMAGTVYVDRGAGGSAEKAKAGMRAAEDAGVPVAFFPEGTTSNGTEVLPFKSGLLAQALEAHQPVTAAYIRYTLDEDNGPGVTVQDDVCFWGDDANMLKHIYKFVGLRGAHAWVKIARCPMTFSGAALEDRKIAAEEAREAVVTLISGEADCPPVGVVEDAVLHQK